MLNKGGESVQRNQCMQAFSCDEAERFDHSWCLSTAMRTCGRSEGGSRIWRRPQDHAALRNSLAPRAPPLGKPDLHLHLADAFIQSDLHMCDLQCIHILHLH